MFSVPHRWRLFILYIFTAFAVNGQPVDADHTWTRFRGPNGTGISPATTVPVSWAAQDYNWRVKLPAGHSSPVLVGDRIFILGSDAGSAQRSLLCLHTNDGKVRWRKDYASKAYRMHQHNDYASSTPVADHHGVIVTWSTPEQLLMLALDLDGNERWRRDLGPYKGLHGSGSSPIIVGDLVVLANDQMDPMVMKRYLPKGTPLTPPGKSVLLGLDRSTGKTRWTVERRTRLAGYATPSLRHTAEGKPELLFTGTAHGITAIDPGTGKVNWEIDDVFASRTVHSPLAAGGLVFASHGAGLNGQRFVAVRPGTEGKPELAWELKRSVPLVPTSIVKDGTLYLWADNGMVSCLEAATGKVLWRERVNGSYYGSPVCVNDVLYCVTRSGEVVVIAAAPRFQLLARIPLGEPSFATPAVADGIMYLRTRSQLFSLGGP